MKENRCYPAWHCAGVLNCSFFDNKKDSEDCFWRECDRDGEWCNNERAQRDAIGEIEL